MQLTLSESRDDLRRAYRDDGVVPLMGLVPPEPLAAIQRAVADYRAAPLDGERTSVKHLPGRIVIRGLAHATDAVARLVGDRDVAELVADIAGTGPMTCWNDLTLIYAPRSPHGESAWHHDVPAFPMRAAALPSLWIALTAVDEDRSPLVFVPGSHRESPLYPPSTAADAALPHGYAPMPDWDAMIARGEARRMWWPMRPGDAILLDAHVVHCTPANRAEDEERVSLITRWRGADATWHRDAYSTAVPGVAAADWQPGERVPELLFA